MPRYPDLIADTIRDAAIELRVAMEDGHLNAPTLSRIAQDGADALLGQLEAAGEVDQLRGIVAELIASALGMAMGAAEAARVTAEMQAAGTPTPFSTLH